MGVVFGYDRWGVANSFTLCAFQEVEIPRPSAKRGKLKKPAGRSLVAARGSSTAFVLDCFHNATVQGAVGACLSSALDTNVTTLSTCHQIGSVPLYITLTNVTDRIECVWKCVLHRVCVSAAREPSGGSSVMRAADSSSQLFTSEAGSSSAPPPPPLPPPPVVHTTTTSAPSTSTVEPMSVPASTSSAVSTGVVQPSIPSKVRFSIPLAHQPLYRA
jgi:hypothetical protein